MAPATCGRTADRLFPSIEIVILVGRQPTFVVLNVALPVFFFVPMAILQFCVPREMTADRLSVSLAIVLTTIAHKYSMTTMVPQLSCTYSLPHERKCAVDQIASCTLRATHTPRS